MQIFFQPAPALRVVIRRFPYTLVDMDTKAAQEYALKRMGDELPPCYCYHTARHARQVMADAGAFARHEGLSEETCDLIVTAAAFHDLGYIRGQAGHEERSIAMAEEVLPRYGFPPEAIARIADMIRTTALPLIPETEEGKILRDADIGALGTVDFMASTELYRKELEGQGKKFSLREWYELEIRFFSSFRYLSRSGAALREAVRIKNLSWFIEELGKLS